MRASTAWTSLSSTFGGNSLSYIRASIVIEDLLGWLPQGWETKPLSEFPQLWADRRHYGRGKPGSV